MSNYLTVEIKDIKKMYILSQIKIQQGQKLSIRT